VPFGVSGVEPDLSAVPGAGHGTHVGFAAGERRLCGRAAVGPCRTWCWS